MKRIVLLSLLIIASLCLSAQSSFTYDFNNLNVGPLNGQDGWVSVKHSAGGGINEVDYIGPQGWVSYDESLAVYFKNANTNFGEVATHKNTTTFPVDFSQGGTYEIELDMHRNWWGTAFGVGYDADGDGSVLPPMTYEAVHPNPSLPSQDGGIWLAITGEDPRPTFKCGIVLPNNTLPNNFHYDFKGWTRWRIMIDMEANNGQGSVALFADHGITGEFQPIPEIQGINAGLTPGSGDRFDPAMWDGVFFLSSSHGGFDNLTIKHTPAGLATQFIDFEPIADKLIQDQPFNITATATSGLPVSFEVLEGPATLNGNTVTLNGTPGIVKIKATQGGDNQFQAAPPVTRSFEVVDPAAYTPVIKIRRPYDGTKVYMESLMPVNMVVSVDIEHSDVILVENMEFNINGQSYTCTNTGENYFMTKWTPESFGTHSVDLTVVMSGGNAYNESATFEVTDQIEDVSVVSFNGDLKIHPENHVITGEFVFPTFVGAFNKIDALLDMNCAPGGCDTYDRVGTIRAKNVHGQMIELFKYITSFGVTCSDVADATDYSSVLQGLVEMEIEVVTWNGDGYLPVLTIDYNKGTPEYLYSDAVEIWCNIYDFGDYSNLQPVPQAYWEFNPNVQKASMKMSTTGHNWSSNTPPNYSVNTDNAAEFYEGTHYININGNQTFTQHLWPENGTCSPNPAGCQPQNGTWTYARQGWCPGSVAMIWDWDLTDFINNGTIQLDYIFDPSYTDYCHPNYPDCIDGQNGCPNCGAPDNPLLNVSAKIITYSNSPDIILDVKDPQSAINKFDFSVYPNPSDGNIEINTLYNGNMIVSIIDIVTGRICKQFSWNGQTQKLDLSTYSKGTYIIKAETESGKAVIEKIVIL